MQYTFPGSKNHLKRLNDMNAARLIAQIIRAQ